ncbi:hypothetical protein [Bacillus arachidis]|uniref:hypothetical protein n=1 Tax=Bacillus arachidis TaxID=2819290 RepID=UPI00255CBD74|nr:hypothetical protein [Bacillus arachidis]WIY61569.1 hypothetical protein QRY57_02910 [Bacillus arachidis]
MLMKQIFKTISKGYDEIEKMEERLFLQIMKKIDIPLDKIPNSVEREYKDHIFVTKSSR